MGFDDGEKGQEAYRTALQRFLQLDVDSLSESFTSVLNKVLIWYSSFAYEELNRCKIMLIFLSFVREST